MALRKNQALTVKIVDLNRMGFGVAKVEGMAVFVAGTVSGDVADILLIKVQSSYAVGKLCRLVTPSPLRTEERCDVAGCTACAYRYVRYDEERRLKKEAVIHAFRKAGLQDIPIGDVLTAGDIAGYRNKAQYPVARDRSGHTVIGFYAPHSHRVTEAAACPLSPGIFRGILDEIRCFSDDTGLSVYDETTGQGLLRHLYLRRGEVTGEILLTLVVNGDALPGEEDLVARLTSRFPALVGILLNTNRQNTNVVLGDRYRTLWGRDHITDVLAGVKLEIAAPAFYQVNHAGAELLYRLARDLAAPTGREILLDLFCGTGSIGLSMAKDVRELIGVEIVPEAVTCAARNARAAGLTNAHFYAGDATGTEELLAAAERQRGERILPDIVILDPPRAGCDEKLLAYVASLRPVKIVYVSCNPETLARDISRLLPAGYRPSPVTPVDMFPGTGHVESVVCLTRYDDTAPAQSKSGENALSP